MNRSLPCAFLVAVIALFPTRALAQHAFEIAGVRALGMAGAFVGVADDATAVYWNPAGLPSGSVVGATIGWDRFQVGNQSQPLVAGPRAQSGRINSLGGWPLGLSNTRLQTSTLRAGPDGEVIADTFITSEWGVTLVQSIVPGLVVGSTLKYVRGRFSSAIADESDVDGALDAAADLEGDTGNRFDADLAVMADMSRVRIGVVLKNLKSPTYTDESGTAIRQKRHARFGAAVIPVSGLTLAIDVDLDTVDLRDGLRRNMALGGEARLASRAALRGGVRWSLEGSRRLVTSIGGSVAVRRGFWVDGYLSHGAEETARGFGVALRAAY